MCVMYDSIVGTLHRSFKNFPSMLEVLRIISRQYENSIKMQISLVTHIPRFNKHNDMVEFETCCPRESQNESKPILV